MILGFKRRGYGRGQVKKASTFARNAVGDVLLATGCCTKHSALAANHTGHTGASKA